MHRIEAELQRRDARSAGLRRLPVEALVAAVAE